MCTTDAPAPPMDMLLLRSDGRSIPVEIHALPLRYAGQTVFLIIVRDRTLQVEAAAERCLLERQLKEARKLESFGLLAGGVVHDFNNILSVLLGNAQLAGRLMECEETEAAPESPTGNQLRQSIHAIVQATRSAITLVQQLFATTGKGMQPYHLLHLPSLCHEVQQMLQASFPATALLVNDVDGGAPLIWGDQAQVLQVMMNLLTNAMEALGGMPGMVQMTALTAPLDRAARDATLMGYGNDSCSFKRCYITLSCDCGVVFHAIWLCTHDTSRQHILDTCESPRRFSLRLGESTPLLHAA